MAVPVGPPPSKLVVADLKRGDGRAAKAGDELSVRYFTLDYRGHQVYEDDWEPPTSTFILGEGQRTQAWEEGLPGIEAGGRRELVVPGGAGGTGSAPEIYVVEAISVKPAKPASALPGASTIKVKGTGPKPRLRYPATPPKHVVVRILKEGAAGPRVRPGEELAVRYVGGNPRTKFVQDFWSEEDPYRFSLGGNRLGKAWEIGLRGMRLGGRRELVVPSRLAYGEGMMVYVIELLQMEKRPRR